MARTRKLRPVWLLVFCSLALTAYTWTDLGRLSGILRQSLPFAIALAISEMLFISGMVLAAVGSLGSLKTSHQRRQLFKTAADNPLVRIGFVVNWIGATCTGIIGFMGILVVFPYQSWGLLYLPVLDLVATFGRCLPIFRQCTRPQAGALTIRQVRADDVDAHLAVQAKEWPAKLNATAAMVRNRVAINPGGIFVAEVDGLHVGMVTTIRLSGYDYARSPSWSEITAEGWCHSHHPRGSIIYGVDLTVSRYAPAGTPEQLLLAIGRSAVRSGVKYCMLGGRMPRFYKHAEMPPAEYMLARTSTGRYRDPEIEVYSRIPGLEIVQLLPDYIDDPASLNYGVLLRWRNPFYKIPGRRLWAGVFPVMYRIEKRFAASRRQVSA